MSGEMIEVEIERLAADNCRLVAQRDEANLKWAMQLAAKKVIIAERDAAERERTESRAEVTKLTEASAGLIAKLNHAGAELQIATDERDAARIEAINWQQRAEAAKHAAKVDADALRTAQQWISDGNEKINVLTTERDSALNEANNWKQHAQLLTADNCRLVDQRNAALADMERLTEDRDNWQQRAEALEQAAQRLTVENEGLRADLLAHPPQRLDLQQYANLKADHELQVTIIETLREGLKRTETLLATAQAKQIDQRLQGFLAVIEQLSSQVQEMLP